MIVDIAVIIVLLGSALIAFLRGFIREVLTIFGIIGGMVASYVGGPLLKPLMRGWLGVVEGEEPKKLFDLVPYPIVADVLAYGTVLIVFVIVLSILSHFLSEGARKIGLGPLDRTLGVLFGLARGVVVHGLLYLPFFYLVDQEQKDLWFADSKTHMYLEMASSTIASFVPADTAQKLEEQAKETGDNMSGARKALDAMDLLGGAKKEGAPVAGQPQDPAGQPPANAPDQATPKDGYNKDFRENMNQLFEQNTGNTTNNKTDKAAE